ncbi:MAG: maleylpyruvate isomerase family mycothiol-dependent enzyme [Actinomycetota bacterium]
MTGTADTLIDDLADEVASLAGVLSGAGDGAWDLPTPAEGWDVREQVIHLLMIDERCLWSIADPARFTADMQQMAAAGGLEGIQSALRGMEPARLTELWVEGAATLRQVGAAADPKARCLWYGPSMSVTSMLTARLMETWAHGQDICDALGADRAPTDRLRHIAHIGVRARPFSYAANKSVMPPVDVRVELTAPSGGVWTWGEPSPDTVSPQSSGWRLWVTARQNPSASPVTVSGDGPPQVHTPPDGAVSSTRTSTGGITLLFAAYENGRARTPMWAM